MGVTIQRRNKLEKIANNYNEEINKKK